MKAKRYWNGAASELDKGGDLVLRHVPAKSDVWVLAKPPPLGSGKRWGDTPRIVGMNRTGTKKVVLGRDGGDVIKRYMWRADHRTKRLGPVWLRKDRDGTLPVEGVVVIPPWARSLS